MLKRLITTMILLSLCAGVVLGAQKKTILPKGATPNAAWTPHGDSEAAVLHKKSVEPTEWT